MLDRKVRDYYAFAFALLILLPALSACGEEKAQALYSAARSFQKEANLAIDSYEAIYQAAVQRIPTSDEIRIRQFLDAAQERYKKEQELDSEQIINVLDVRTKDTKLQETITVEFAEIRLYYDTFADSLARLPEASFLAREQVACSAEIAIRLVQSLLNYSQRIKKRPVYLARPAAELTEMLEVAFDKKETAAQMRIAMQLMELANKRYELHQAAVKQSLVAAEAGITVVELARQYDDIKLADVLNGINQVLGLANSVKGLNLDLAVQMMADVQKRLKSDAHWQRILAMKLGDVGTPCKPRKEDV